MITENFNERTLANMEVALERACERLPKEMDNYEVRKQIAAKILNLVAKGDRTLKSLTEVAMAAASDVQLSERTATKRRA